MGMRYIKNFRSTPAFCTCVSGARPSITASPAVRSTLPWPVLPLPLHHLVCVWWVGGSPAPLWWLLGFAHPVHKAGGAATVCSNCDPRCSDTLAAVMSRRSLKLSLSYFFPSFLVFRVPRLEGWSLSTHIGFWFYSQICVYSL